MSTFRSLLAGTALLVAIAGCAAAPAGSPAASSSSTGQTGIGGRATAGPVCPVETVPPDPNCAPRPVAGAALVVRDNLGREVARGMTIADGTFFIATPAGAYTVEPQPVDGLMGTAPPQDAMVSTGAMTTITVVYDTGIRGPDVAPS